MRIENGGVAPRPEKGSGIQENPRKSVGDKSLSTSKAGDSVDISNAARMLHSNRSDTTGERGGDFAGDPTHLKEIHQRMDSEFYDSGEAMTAVANRLLEVFGL